MMEKEEGERYLKFMACLLMIDRAYTGGLVMSEEKSRLLNAIQKGDKPKERTPVDENEVIEKLNNEFYKMKIENNVSKNKVSGTYFENGRSRYDDWRAFKNSSEFKRFKRSDSRPGFWRSDSKYVRQPSRSRSRLSFETRKPDVSSYMSRSRSRSRHDGINDRKNVVKGEIEKLKGSYSRLEKKTEEIAKSNEEIVKMLEKIEKI